MSIKPEESEVLLDQLRNKFRREVKMDLIHEIQEMDEVNHVVPLAIVSPLQRHNRKLEIGFAIVLGLFFGLASVPITFMILSILS